MKMEDCTVEENVQIAKDTYKMKIKGNFVKECRTPGQFVNIRIGDGREHVLRRPISISEIDRGENLVTIIYSRPREFYRAGRLDVFQSGDPTN